MRFSNAEIREELKSYWNEITEQTYPEDWLTQFADGLAPVYYGEIIKDWQEMPFEYTDSGGDHLTAEAGIFDRMSADLFWYYRETVEAEYEKLKEEKEEKEVTA